MAIDSFDEATLQHLERKLLTCIQPGDLANFSSMLKDNILIPPEAKEEVDLMHTDVPHTRRCRYVLQHVYEAIEEDESNYKVFLRTISALTHCNIMKELRDFKKQLQSDDIKLGKLGDKDLGPLYIFLSKYAHKWEDLGILLLRDSNYLQYIQHECSNVSRKCLRMMLETWLSGKCNCSISPTLKNLNRVLRSDVVELAREVENLVEHLRSWSMALADGSGSSSDSENEDHILNEKRTVLLGPRNVRETDNEVAVLLELHTTVTLDNVIAYEWYKDGQNLRNGTYANIFCVRVTDLTAEGTYKCVCNYGKDGSTKSVGSSVKMTVRTPVDKFKQVLINRYSMEPVIPEDTWPIVNQTTFIKLAVVKEKGTYREDTFTYQTIAGNADDILLEKANTEYLSVFGPVISGDRILIEGHPGSGKTTLVRKISQDWATGVFKWNHVRLLILVSLRGFQSDSSIHLKDLICYYYDSSLQISSIIKYAEKHGGLGIGFILDGMDEYRPQGMKSTYINKLLECLAMPRALVVAVSRPAAVAKYRRRVNMRIEVRGFFKEQIADYIESYQFSSQSKCSDLIKYLEDHPNVHHMCYLPIQAAMVCFLFDELGGSLPRTETEIYKEFTKHAVLRTMYRYREESETYLESIFKLQGEERNYFCDICRLAFEMTCFSKQIVLQSQLDSFSLKGSVHSSLGLITMDVAATRCGFQSAYTFFHLTFQEFLAACHVCFLSDAVQLEIIEKYGDTRNMQEVFKFYCGLVQFSEKCLKFKALLRHYNFDVLVRAHCSFESQQERICDYAVQNGSMDLCKQFLSPRDLVSIGYVIVNAKQNPVKHLRVSAFLHAESLEAFIKELRRGSNCVESVHVDTERPQTEISVSDEAVTMADFIRCNFKVITNLIECCTGLTSLTLNSTSMGSRNVQYLAQVLLNCKKLASLELNSDCIDCNEMMVLTQPIQNCSGSLAVLHLHDNMIGDNGVEVLAQALRNCSSLVLLDLGKNSISSIGAEAVSCALQNCSNLTSLDLSENSIGVDGAKALDKVLQNCSKLTALALIDTSISDLGVCTLAQSLQGNCRNMATLYLSRNEISAAGAQALADALQQAHCLTSLDLGVNSIADDGAQALAQALRNCSNLSSLILGGNEISDIGATVLGEALQSCNNLVSLDLGENDISDDGVEVLAVALHNCKFLQTVDLGGNDITSRGAEAVRNALQDCKSLTSLDLYNWE